MIVGWLPVVPALGTVAPPRPPWWPAGAAEARSWPGHFGGPRSGAAAAALATVGAAPGRARWTDEEGTAWSLWDVEG